MIDRQIFFDSVRPKPFGGKVSHSQVEGMSYILDAYEMGYADWDLRWLAYALRKEARVATPPAAGTLDEARARRASVCHNESFKSRNSSPVKSLGVPQIKRCGLRGGRRRHPKTV